ncbi:glycoside hydrolase family 19 protein [Aquamicrobium ahrensii]|uniref:Chitinase n=1 Tax=Aquamicrobium ahrensii TaxID=469551 RepID=A0ABV2KPI1_9HYPH
MDRTVPSGAAITLAQIERIVGKLSAKQKANANSLAEGLAAYGLQAGLSQPHRLAQFLAQILHESGAFNYDREIWGPTPAQKRYEGRADLGNVQKGDGSRYRGRGPIQITGRTNYRAFTKWAKKIDPKAPNFETTPDAVVTDPWEGLGPIWYWDAGNPEGRSLNRYADDNNIEMITRRVNGGLNGFADRVNWYVRAALVLLGYGPAEVKRFQQNHPEAGMADGIAGEKTRMALHKALSGANPYREVETFEREIEVEIPTIPEAVETKVKEKVDWWTKLTGGGGVAGLGLSAFLGADWQAVLAGGAVLIAVILILVLLRSQIGEVIRDIRGALA